MIRRLALVIMLIAAPLLAAADETWRVTITVYPGDDPAATAKRLAATYRGELQTQVGSDGTFVIALSSTRAALLGRDPSVAAVAPATTSPVAQTVTIESWDLGDYKYDDSGNIRKIGSDVFVYDTMGRLRSGAVAGTTQSYTYDGFGNIRTITTGAETTAVLGVDVATNRMDKAGVESTSAQTANMVATYDVSGNLTAYHPDTFQYDALNVMTKSNVGGKWRSYVYTASDERIATIELTGATGSETRSDWTIRDMSGKVLRRFSRENGVWQWNQDYVYRGDQMLASDIPGPIKRYHYHLDHLGTPRLITGNGGAQISRHTYYAFGRETVMTATDGERKQFTGHERDAAGLDYMHARFYNGFMGRFLSVDPYLNVKKAMRNPQTWNRYSYVRNNPINSIDPDGRDDLFIGEDFKEPFRKSNRATIDGWAVAKELLHVEELKEAFSGFGAAPANEKLMAAMVGVIATADIASWFVGGGEAKGVAKLFGEGAEAIGFKSFAAFKNVFGRAGPDMHWHHIVEQTAGNAARFGAEALHNTVNLIKVDAKTHGKISAHYSSKIPGVTGNKTVREWLATKSYKEQYEYGMQVLRQYGVIP